MSFILRLKDLFNSAGPEEPRRFISHPKNHSSLKLLLGILGIFLWILFCYFACFLCLGLVVNMKIG